MEQYILQSASFKKLKGLQEANFTFGEYLTAIMGVNGSGKNDSYSCTSLCLPTPRKRKWRKP